MTHLYVSVTFSRAAELCAEGWEYAGSDPRYRCAPFFRVWMRKLA